MTGMLSASTRRITVNPSQTTIAANRRNTVSFSVTDSVASNRNSCESPESFHTRPESQFAGFNGARGENEFGGSRAKESVTQESEYGGGGAMIVVPPYFRPSIVALIAEMEVICSQSLDDA
ncbi:hypothetical protein HK100_000889 [Physocladia obscura]|uniref:Uncharacterized protein n=1 Tax=Physocladia obscura TaxID=109957 RepID=A0AAD5T3P5_9FUNG|nr:hypothetical protein HK100_000889 [Physocladia obscura]